VEWGSRIIFAQQHFSGPKCRDGSKATMSVPRHDVRYSPNSDHLLRGSKVTLCAISDQSAMQQNSAYSITSAVARKGNDFTCRFPLAAAAVAVLPARSCLIDGEAIVTGDDGLAVFELIRRQRYGGRAVLCAFDLLELDGQDLRRQPIEERKRILATLVRGPHPGIASVSTSSATARSCSNTPASLAAKVSC